jgi:tRNA nucleotidyltransferase/poly(A) polymerase
MIDEDALKVMYRLLRHGYQAFLVGGGVRDLLLNRRPKDFDVGTDARPNEIRSLFRNSRIIGRRFRLVHVFFRGQKVIEVSTLRRSAEASADGEVPLLASDNTYGDAESDALRRDLTINGLFYDLSTFSVVDYVGGMADLEQGVVRIIGDPEVRLQEDPVRMLRAARHAAKAKFRIETLTSESIRRNADRISLCPKARISEELLRELRYGSTVASFRLFEELGLLTYLIPALAKVLEGGDQESRRCLYSALSKLDAAALSGKELSPAVLYAALFIGVCSPRKFGVGSSKVAKETQEYAWSARPFADYEDASNGDARSVRDYIVAARQGALKRSIDEWFRPLGVSRKERERMEQLLTSRLLMFGEYYGQGKTTGLMQKSYFFDALELVHVTAHDDEAMGCWEYWNSRAKSQRVKKGGQGTPGKRKQRRSSGQRRYRKPKG